MAGTAARCKSITISGEVAENPVSASIIRDSELLKKVYSNTRVGKYFLGEVVEGLRVTFSDVAAYEANKKGDYIDTLVVVFDGANEITSSGSSATSAVVTATLNGGVVTEAVEFESTSGEPIEYTLTVMVARVGSTDGSLVLT